MWHHLGYVCWPCGLHGPHVVAWAVASTGANVVPRAAWHHLVPMWCHGPHGTIWDPVDPPGASPRRRAEGRSVERPTFQVAAYMRRPPQPSRRNPRSNNTQPGQPGDHGSGLASGGAVRPWPSRRRSERARARRPTASALLLATRHHSIRLRPRGRPPVLPGLHRGGRHGCMPNADGAQV